MSDLLQLDILVEHMKKKFEINKTKIKGGCQSGIKVVTHNSKSDLPLAVTGTVCKKKRLKLCKKSKKN